MKFYIKDGSESAERTTEFPSANEEHSAWNASLAAEFSYDNHDGSNWMKDGCILVLVKDDGTESEWKITVDFEPTFYADAMEQNNEQ